ncbi:hypothetical protein BEWA_023040 [Theileria equi strain WA]|uniref:Uncharacterized protein n=1 Tax=Theileria equi strain WA TaxID=1537102 RepID=L0AWR5_THEEQ|nr:hypothetical protein BEWA_023040 [Theileria equi strain WA]AFZ79456.1 hypothetical protein BEWA_023040 [Theileria equi strain WA]|eukprot:XP_004829122.1 hypothetical protein BEWA_023040 [Theileria equi strain WA]
MSSISTRQPYSAVNDIQNRCICLYKMDNHNDGAIPTVSVLKFRGTLALLFVIDKNALLMKVWR